MYPSVSTCLVLALLSQQPGAPEAAPDTFRPDPAWKSLGPHVWFNPTDRELILRARVALREGYLEHLLCLERTKEHESVLATDASPRTIHAGLILVAGEPGSGVRYRPEFAPPKGPPIQIELVWTQDGKEMRADARTWVKDEAKKAPLATDWVFAGSELFQDPDSKKVIYAADAGDLITVANFPSAILDVPFASSNSDAERSFVAFSDHIPPRGTPITMILRKAGAPPKAAAADAKP